MAEIRFLSDTSLATIIDDNASLADGVRAAGDLDNDTELDLGILYFLQEQFDTTAPSAGDTVAELYNIPGDGEVSETYPEGGDAGLGTNDTPQRIFYVSGFETVNPSTSVNEVLGASGSLWPHGNRHVILNTSGQTFDLTWQLTGKPWKLQSV